MHLVDVTMFFARESGGVKRYLLAKHEWLRQHTRHRHTIVVPDRAVNDEPSLVTVGGIPIPFSNGYRFPVRSQAIQQQLAALQPDIIEAGDPYLMGRAALASGQKSGVPVVGFYHSDLPRMLGQRLGSTVESLATRYVKNFYRAFDLVLAPSQTMVNYLHELGIEQARVQALGVNTAVFSPAHRDVDLRSDFDLAPDTKLLVFVGRFAREKNLPLLLRAMKLLGSSYHLFMIGSGAEIPVQTNVTPLPFQGDAHHLAALMGGCDAFIHPGDQETFGLVVLEAMACGLPVVGMAAGAVAELIDDEVGILVPPNNAHELAAGISALFERDTRQLGQQARRKAVAQYDWEQVFPQLLQRYENLVAQQTSVSSSVLQTAHAIR